MHVYYSFLNGVNNGIRYEGTYLATQGQVFGSCDEWIDSSLWKATYKAQLMDLAYASMDSFQVRSSFFTYWACSEVDTRPGHAMPCHAMPCLAFRTGVFWTWKISNSSTYGRVAVSFILTCVVSSMLSE